MALTKKNYYRNVDAEKQPEYKIEFSFDDGGELDTVVAGLLSKYNKTAVFYIIVDRVGKPGFLTWDQIKDLDEHGFEIGSHTVTHPQDLKGLFDEDLYFEVQNSKDMLEAVLGHSVSKFCYPRGRFDERVKRVVIEAEYVEARGTGRTGVLDASDKYALPGTIHLFQREEYGELDVLTYAKQIIDKVKKEGGYCNIWGHSKEIEENNLWGVFEEILKYVS